MASELRSQLYIFEHSTNCNEISFHPRLIPKFSCFAPPADLSLQQVPSIFVLKIAQRSIESTAPPQ